MVKNKYSILLIWLMLLSCLSARPVMAEDYAKSVEVVRGDINFSQTEFPRVAYLYMELKNNGDRDIENLNFRITYYDKEECLIKKVVMKDKLNEPIPSGESRKCRVRLKGDVFNVKNEEYPYSEKEEVGEFDIKILNVKFAKKI